MALKMWKIPLPFNAIWFLQYMPSGYMNSKNDVKLLI